MTHIYNSPYWFFAQQKSSQYCRNVYKVNIAGGRSSFSSFSFLALFINGCVSCLFKHMTVFHSSIHQHHQSKSRKLLIRAIMCAWVQNAHQVIHQQNCTIYHSFLMETQVREMSVIKGRNLPIWGHNTVGFSKLLSKAWIMQ